LNPIHKAAHPGKQDAPLFFASEQTRGGFPSFVGLFVGCFLDSLFPQGFRTNNLQILQIIIIFAGEYRNNLSGYPATRLSHNPAKQ